MYFQQMLMSVELIPIVTTMPDVQILWGAIRVIARMATKAMG